MGFYRDLSPYYDEVFAVDDAEMRFVSSLLRGRERLLDIGCGTGNKTVLLAKGVKTAVGVDSDEGMVARANAANAAPGVSYEVLDMASIAARFAPASFDAAVCLGNTLVHLPDAAAIRELCASVRGVLAPEGMFVCQILNYDRILDRHITDLPVLDTPRARFSRSYVPEGNHLLFTTELYMKDTGETAGNAIPLYPMRPDALDAALGKAGFSGLARYGSYAGGPFTEDSFILIVSAVA